VTLSDRARRISTFANKIRAQEEELGLLLEWDREWAARMDWLAPLPLERGWGWPFFWFSEMASW
jgi:hypothetical protein